MYGKMPESMASTQPEEVQVHGALGKASRAYCLQRGTKDRPKQSRSNCQYGEPKGRNGGKVIFGPRWLLLKIY